MAVDTISPLCDAVIMFFPFTIFNIYSDEVLYDHYFFSGYPKPIVLTILDKLFIM